MSRLADAIVNLRIAIRFIYFEKAAADAINDDDRTVWRSFWSLPFFILLQIASSSLSASAFAEADNITLPETSPFAVGWVIVGWFLGLNIAAEFARSLNRFEYFPRFVIARNWAALVQGFVVTVGAAVIVALDGGLDLFQFWMMVAGFWSLVYDWFIVKTTLRVSGGAAAMLMAVLLLVTLFLARFSASFA